MPQLPVTWNLSVPLNFGAYTNGSYSSTSPLALEFTDPKRYARFFAYGGGNSYSYGSLVVTSTRTTPIVTRTTTTSSTPTPTEDITPNPSAYQNGRVGSGRRDYIYGSSRWGSGISIPSDGIPGNASWTPYNFPSRTSWPNPFGFWPIYWGEGVPNYYQDSWVYKSSRFRPGGEQNLILASLGVTPTWRPYWYIITDAHTIKGLNNILSLPVNKGGCGMYPDNPIYTFDPVEISPMGTRTLIPADGTPLPRQNFTLAAESALQYYRGSSVALGTPGYLNAWALDHNKNTSYWGMTPWNITDLFPLYFNTSDSMNEGANLTARYAAELSFVKCLNTTIAAAVPIIDPDYTEPSSSSSKVSPWQWVGISLGVGCTILLLGICIAHRCLASVIERITGKKFPGWRPRRVRLGRHTGGPRVVFPQGEILPNYSNEPIMFPIYRTR
ncbi:hypothetical protein CPB86DRAFT_872538 [Serendipita vermifera]|nr:hypothetical protein CPB86DRAFT_872538 [Serendipita vermifera]